MDLTKKVRPRIQGGLLKAFLLTCVMLCFSFHALAQQTVSGTVVDIDNQPMIGVVVQQKGGTIGTSTDFDGKYTIKVPQGTTLNFSYMGYKSQEIVVGSQSKINVTMEEDSKQLDEVVVVGYSAIRKQSLTGSLQVVGEKKLVEGNTTTNVENMLTGKVPGVNVSSGSGQPGSPGKIVIRGATTLNGATDPLWVVDGVIMGNSGVEVNSADIETFTVLKDAASTAIYGSQGANGVVLVTTKSGKSGQMKVNVSAKFVATTLNKGNFDVMSGSELYDTFSKYKDIDTDWLKPELRDRNFDWWDNATQTGFAQDYNVSLNGGTDKLNTYVSVGMYDESGAVKGYDYSRYSFMAKVQYKPNSRLTIKPSVSANLRKIDDKQHSVGAMYSNLPWDSPYKADGSLIGEKEDIRNEWVATSGTNYMYDRQWNKTKRKTHEITANFDFDVKIFDWLTFASVNSYKYSNHESTSMTDPKSIAGRAREGEMEEINRNFNRTYTSQLLRLNKEIGKHYISAVAGYEWNELKAKWTNSVATGFPSGVSVQDAAAKAYKTKGNRLSSATQSFLTNVNYTYDDRYIGQVSYRRDGASNFGLNNQYGNFFSVSGAWNVDQEKFFKCEFIDKLKLRASYGSVGNRPTSSYSHLPLYGVSVDYGYNGETGILGLARMGNPDLKWEKTYTLGVGVDVSFLNRFTLSVDYYHKNTSDLVYDVVLPVVTGKNVIMLNDGKLENQGIEIVLGAQIFDTKDIGWRIDANFGLNRNKIKELYQGQQEMKHANASGIAGTPDQLWTVGKDASTWYLPEWAGVDPQTGVGTWYKTDTNGDRVITTKYDEADNVGFSKYNPNFFGGFSTDVRYKDFDLSANFSYSVGGKIYNYARMEYDSDGVYTNRNQMKLHSNWKRWEKPGDIVTHPQGIYNNKDKYNAKSSRYLETATYLKMKSLTIGYNVPLKIKGISKIRLTASGENLFTITHFSGVDPEIAPKQAWENGASSQSITGIATAMYPSTRKFVFGLNLTL